MSYLFSFLLKSSVFKFLCSISLLLFVLLLVIGFSWTSFLLISLLLLLSFLFDTVSFCSTGFLIYLDWVCGWVCGWVWFCCTGGFCSGCAFGCVCWVWYIWFLFWDNGVVFVFVVGFVGTWDFFSKIFLLILLPPEVLVDVIFSFGLLISCFWFVTNFDLYTPVGIWETGFGLISSFLVTAGFISLLRVDFVAGCFDFSCQVFHIAIRIY